MAKPIAAHLAQNILILRKKQGLSQERLSVMSQIPRSTITHIESGSSNPTLENLSKLAMALQVRIEELLTPPRAEVVFQLESDLKQIEKSSGKIRITKLIPDFMNGVDIDRMEFESGTRLGGVPHLSGTKEFFTCLEGEFTVTVSGDSYRVKKGQVLHFPGDQRHSYTNTAKRKSLAMSVIAFSYP